VAYGTTQVSSEVEHDTDEYIMKAQKCPHEASMTDWVMYISMQTFVLSYDQREFGKTTFTGTFLWHFNQ